MSVKRLLHLGRAERGDSKRKGAILVLAALFLLAVMAIMAFSIDVGYINATKTELQRATDAAALAGAGALVEGPDKAQLAAFEYMVRNPVGQRVLAEGSNWQDNLANTMSQNHDVQIVAGYWNPQGTDNPQTLQDERFTPYDPSLGPPIAVRVQATQANVSLFFGNLMRKTQTVYDKSGVHKENVPIDLSAQSIARYQPRDIALVLDFSGSMNDDSSLVRIAEAAAADKAAVKTAIEASLTKIDGELKTIPSPPNTGTLPFTPAWPKVEGQAASGQIPHCTVTFGTDANGVKEVTVTSTMSLKQVIIQTDNNSKQTFSSLSGTSGTFKGTTSGGTKNKRIVKVWVKSGSNDPDGDGYGEQFANDNASIKKAFGLDKVTYPYPAGSWDEYIDYANSNSNVSAAGYQYMYGRESLIDYWLQSRAKYSETPDLWRVSAQPITSLKDGVDIFMDYINEVKTEDRVAFTIYNSSNGTGKLEQPLTYDFSNISTMVRQRQASHYDAYTNIGAGIQYGRQELENNGRTGALKMMVLMTDGCANRPTNESTGRSFAISQAQIMADHKWPIICISLGNDADTSIMQQIADMTKGIHFNVPGGATITDYAPQLKAVFKKIADHRPLVLVK